MTAPPLDADAVLAAARGIASPSLVVGGVVTLQSGGLAMTIIRAPSESEPTVCCVFFDAKGALQYFTGPPEMVLPQ